jgi:hypothetical protein
MLRIQNHHHVMTLNIFAAASTLACLVLASCSTGQGDRIEKVKTYNLDHKKHITAVDPAIRFEQHHRLFGTVSIKDMEARDGHYYTVRWGLADGSQPAKLILEYRQAKTGATVLKKEMDVSSAGGTSEFTVIGDEAKGNAVTGWKVSLVRGKDTLATAKSYLWE